MLCQVESLKTYKTFLAYLDQALFSRMISRQFQVAFHGAIKVLDYNKGAFVKKVVSIVLKDTVELKLIIENSREIRFIRH